MDWISMLWLWIWIYVQQANPSEKYLQNYEISERSRRIVVLRSHIPKIKVKKERVDLVQKVLSSQIIYFIHP